MDIGYSPTGKEFVTGSYDRTVRIWRVDSGKSREVYHTKRMQRVFAARFTGDAKFVLSGSDDMNVRIWKADASAPLGRQLPREIAQADYLGALKKRFGHLPEIRRISKCVNRRRRSVQAPTFLILLGFSRPYPVQATPCAKGCPKSCRETARE
jgi:DDB1- and CUL4-associated factor 13